MIIKYDEYEMLELFESEPTPIFEEEQGIFQYKKEDEAGIQLIFIMSIYERQCRFSLNIKKLESRLVEFELNNLVELAKSEERLLLYTKEARDPFIINFNPIFSFSRINIG